MGRSNGLDSTLRVIPHSAEVGFSETPCLVKTVSTQHISQNLWMEIQIEPKNTDMKPSWITIETLRNESPIESTNKKIIPSIIQVLYIDPNRS
jgi:hypothetical protein